MCPADPPTPPDEPASPPAPPELPPTSPPPPIDIPSTMGPDGELSAGAGAKPSVPGPVDPPGIAVSILPQRQEDARRANPQPASNDR